MFPPARVWGAWPPRALRGEWAREVGEMLRVRCRVLPPPAVRGREVRGGMDARLERRRATDMRDLMAFMQCFLRRPDGCG